MTLGELLSRVPEFATFTLTDKVRLFAWHLHVNRGKERFATREIVGCFDEIHTHRPGNASQLITNLASQRHIISDRNGHRLAKDVRESLDAKYGGRSETVTVDRLLSELPTLLSSPAQQNYLEEALICFRSKAFRAAIVMTWNVAYDHLVTVVAASHLPAFNMQASTVLGPKKSGLAKRDDFQRLQESEVITVCNAANIISKEVAKVYTDKLNKRNSAAHPSGSTIDKLQAEAFISDLIKNGMTKVC